MVMREGLCRGVGAIVLSWAKVGKGAIVSKGAIVGKGSMVG